MRDDPVLSARMGILYSKYTPEWHYWEAVVLGKRCIAVLLAAFVRPEMIGVQLSLFTLLSFIYICLILYFRPFKSPFTLRMAATTSVIQYVISFSGL